MAEMIELEVRCCCRPQNLYGWLAVPANLKPGDSFAVAHRVGGVVNLELAEYWERTLVTPEMEQNAIHRAEVRDIRQMAIKSMERPIEFFRALRGFRENEKSGPR